MSAEPDCSKCPLGGVLRSPKSNVHPLSAQRFWAIEIFCSKIRKIFYTFKYSKCFYELGYQNSSQVIYNFLQLIFLFLPFLSIFGIRFKSGIQGPSKFCPSGVLFDPRSAKVLVQYKKSRGVIFKFPATDRTEPLDLEPVGFGPWIPSWNDHF